MYEFFYQKKSALSRKLICSFVALTFSMGLVLGPTSIASAQYVSNLPQPGTMVLLSPAFAPPLLKGMTLHPENPLHFDFIVDRGQDRLSGDALKNETQKLLKYFLAAMTIPDDDSWVNLSPYEGDRIIPDMLGSTDMGKQMLEQDYLLKQLSASLTNPQEEIGKKFWDTVYKKAYEKFGTTAVPINTFNKVWIVPDRALILEEDGYVFIGESHLKVMLDEDYTSVKANLKSEKFGTKNIAQDKVEALNNVSSEVVRQVILPELEKEINEGKNFTAVRQIYHSVILAAWYKQNLKNSLLGRVYVDKSKIAGVDIGEKDLKQKVYEQYLAAFRKGVYNLIKEDYDLSTKETLPRKYFSGGFDWKRTQSIIQKVPGQQLNTIARSIQQATQDGSFASISARMTEGTEAPTVTALAAVASSTVKKPVFGPDAIQISEMIRGIQQRIQDDPRDFLSFVFNSPERLYYLLLELSDIESDQLVYGTRILKKDITSRLDEWFDLADFSNEQLGVLGQILKDRKSGEAESPSSDYLHRIYRESLTRRSPAKQNSKSPLDGLKGARLNKKKINALVKEVAKIKELPSVSEEYLKVLLLKLRDYLSGSVPIDVLGRNFIATAFMTEDEVERELSVTKHRDIVQWAGDNPERVDEILKGATVSYQLLNAGFGDNYRRALWNQQLLREGLIAEIKAGAKSQHLGQKVQLSGYDEQGNQADYEIFVSNVQIHYQRLLMKAMAGEYGQGISIIEMVNEQSDPTITAMLDEVYIYDKVDHRPNVRKRTWREVFAQTEGISHEDNKMMRSFPGFNPVSAEFNIDTGYNGGHAQVPFSRFIELLTEKLPKGKTKIGIMINADGVNNDVPPESIAHMIENNSLINVSVTVRGPTHIKGGILGVRLQPIGQEQSDTAMVPAGMELAGAKALGEVAVALFQATGITEGRKEGQLFNTNNIAWNETALQPFLQELHKIIGEEEYLRVIAPDIIPGAKSYKGEDLLQMEGAALPAILRLNAYLMTTTDSKVKKLLKKHNIDRLVHFDFYSADEVTEFFTEEKTPIHGVLYRSNIYVFNLDTWRFDMSKERKDRFNPLIELSPYYHQDLLVAVDALGKLDLIEAKALRIDGNVLMPNARIVGDVTVNSSFPGDFDLVEWNQKTRTFPITEEGRIVLDNVEITIDRNEKVSFEKIVSQERAQGNVIPSNVDIYEYLATQKFVDVTDIARRLNLVLGTAEEFLAGNGWVETEEPGIYTRPGSVGAAVVGMLNGSASSALRVDEGQSAAIQPKVLLIGSNFTGRLLDRLLGDYDITGTDDLAQAVDFVNNGKFDAIVVENLDAGAVDKLATITQFIQSVNLPKTTQIIGFVPGNAVLGTQAETLKAAGVLFQSNTSTAENKGLEQTTPIQELAKMITAIAQAAAKVNEQSVDANNQKLEVAEPSVLRLGDLTVPGDLNFTVKLADGSEITVMIEKKTIDGTPAFDITPLFGEEPVGNRSFIQRDGRFEKNDSQPEEFAGLISLGVDGTNVVLTSLQGPATVIYSDLANVTQAGANVAASPVGGIDFDPSLLNLQIKRNGKGVPLPLPQQNLENINIDGLYPVIINMQPATIQNFPFLISADKQDKVPELSMR